MNIDELKALSSDVIGQHRPMMPLYQTFAENFYPERADFTVTRNIGNEFADILVDSNPVLLRRDLGDSISSMLRDGDWFSIGVNGDNDHDGAAWLEWASGNMKGLIDQRLSNFVGATKEADHDFITFGSSVISVEINKKANGYLFRTWHLRDCSWFDDENGQVSGFVRNWKPKYRELLDLFKTGLSDVITKAPPKDAFKTVEVRHVVLPVEMCKKDEYIDQKFKFVSYYIDITNDVIIEEKPLNNNMYVVPRFKRFPGTQFAYSPATATALPDARTSQTMQHSLLEVAERYARPPLLATQKAVRGDINLESDGVTYLDDEYDERLGEALRPLTQNMSGYPIGLDARQDVRESLKAAFYTNRLSLPDVSHDMTAYEVQQRMKQYRRENLPLFQPMEVEYNGQLCEKVFDVGYAAGFFGSPQDVPESLLGKDIQFNFVSPLTESEDEKMVSQFDAVTNIVDRASAHNPTFAANVNWDKAGRDAMTGSGAPENWKMSEEAVMKAKQASLAAQAAKVAQEAGIPLNGENENAA